MDELEKIVNEEILVGFPDTRVFAQQGELFGDFGGGGGIRIELQAADYDALLQSVPAAMDIITAAIPGATVWPNPDPQIVNPEIKLVPNDRRIAEVGMIARQRRERGAGRSATASGLASSSTRTSASISSSQANEWGEPEYLSTVPIATPTGSIVPLGELASFERSVGPQQIVRSDGRRTISLGINAPEGVALGDIVETLKKGAEKEIYSVLPEGVVARLRGRSGQPRARHQQSRRQFPARRRHLVPHHGGALQIHPRRRLSSSSRCRWRRSAESSRSAC